MQMEKTVQQKRAFQLQVDQVLVRRRHVDSERLEGQYFLRLEGNFGNSYQTILSWKESLTVEAGTALTFWPEFVRSGDVRLQYVLCLQPVGGFGEPEIRIVEEMRQPFLMEARPYGRQMAVSLRVQGKGSFTIGTIHIREMVEGGAAFLPGSLWMADSEREEIFSYFNPMDRKEPLTVVFSGRRPQEGFDGTELLEEAGSPVLLLSDPRLGGGCGYLGTEQYERNVEARILDAVSWLKLSPEQIIFAGSSMGAVGALYYGARIHPAAYVLGRPLINLGSAAKRERIQRPGGFPVSLDLLRKLTGGVSEEDAGKLDRRMQERLRTGSFRKAEMAVAYMQEDDYDPEAYLDLLHGLRGQECKIYGKGFSGRHNDSQDEVREWLRLQYHRIRKERYGRG